MTPASLALQVSTVQYGDISIKLQEGALGDGLGARVWVVAHTLCRYSIPYVQTRCYMEMCRLATIWLCAGYILHAFASVSMLLATGLLQDQVLSAAPVLFCWCCACTILCKKDVWFSTLLTQALDCTP